MEARVKCKTILCWSSNMILPEQNIADVVRLLTFPTFSIARPQLGFRRSGPRWLKPVGRNAAQS
jgi:hypothetical protein